MSHPFLLQPTVSLILLNDHNEVLMLHRSNTKWFDGYYSLVAGCVDGNEPISQAMIREAYEEANILLKPEWLTLGSVVHTKMAERKCNEAVDFFFIAQKWENPIKNNEPHKHTELKFYPLNNLPKPIIPFVEVGLKKALAHEHYAEYGWPIKVSELQS